MFALLPFAVPVLRGSIAESVIAEVLSRTSYGPPVHLTVQSAEEYGHPYVFAVWGSGFGHRGLKIGPPELRVNDDDRSYHVKWDDGVFGYSEIQ